MKEPTIKPDATIHNAINRLDSVKEKCLAVVDDNNRLLGTLAYSDLRKSIFEGAVFSSSIEKCYNPNPTVLIADKIEASEARELLKNPKIKMLPVVDDQGCYVKSLSLRSLEGEQNQKKIDASVVIMAGGKGTRLDPFTKILPKPLVPIHDKPIIEHIISRFKAVGIHDFYATVNYKSRILKAYFEEIEEDYTIQFVEEHQPLGTAGSLKYLQEKIREPFIVTNCDIIIDTDYIDFYEFHLNYGYDISLIASVKEYIIPYGTCELNGEGHLKCINEKPEYYFLVNTGMYAVNPSVLALIPDRKEYHITHLIEDAKAKGLKIGVYPISDGAWVDVGQWAEYKKALESFTP